MSFGLSRLWLMVITVILDTNCLNAMPLESLTLQVKVYPARFLTG